jgi:hypothetical protein
MMVKKVIVGVIVLFCAVIGLGSNGRNESQKKGARNLSGAWKLDKSKGNYLEYSGLKPQADLILVISHVEPEIKITRKLIWEGQESIQESIYYSDGRGEVSRTLVANMEGKSKTRWSGDKLVSRISAYNKNIGRGKIKVDVIQEWKLSDDGNRLTQIERFPLSDFPGQVNARGSRASIQPGTVVRVYPNEIERVFNRIP